MFIDPGVQVIPTFVTTWSSEDHASPQCRAKMVLDSVPPQQLWCNEPLDQGTTKNRIRKGVTRDMISCILVDFSSGLAQCRIDE